MTDDQIFRIFQYPFLFVLGYIASKTCDILNEGLTIKGKQYIKPKLNYLKIHPFCGILIIGIVAKFIPWRICNNLDTKTNSVIVDFAYVSLIYRGGFGLNLVELKKNFISVVRMALIPDIIDVAFVFMLVTLLFDMPPFIALSLGFMVVPSATGVVIPISLDLKKYGLGTDREVSTILISSCALENIFGNVFYWVMFGFVYTSPAMMMGGIKNPYVTLAQTISEISIAFVGGSIISYTISHTLKNVNPKIIFSITFCMEMLVHFLLKEYLQFRLFGIIFVFTMNSLLRFWMAAEYTNQCTYYSGQVFELSKFILYSSIGAALPLEKLNPSDIGFILLVIFAELFHKVAEIMVISPWSLFSWKERCVFGILLASKGSAQVTLASQIVFYESKKASPDPQMMKFGNQAMTLGVFFLLFGLSLSSSLGLSLGLKWVSKSKDIEDHTHKFEQLRPSPTHEDQIVHSYDQLHEHHHDDEHTHDHDHDHESDHKDFPKLVSISTEIKSLDKIDASTPDLPKSPEIFLSESNELKQITPIGVKNKASPTERR